MIVSEKQSRKRHFSFRGFFAICLLLVTVFAFQHVARAEVYLITGGKTLFIGDTLLISDYFDSEGELDKVVEGSLQYAIADTSQNMDCIELTPDGTVTAVREGKATVNVSYQQTEDNALREESFEVTVIPPETVKAVYGQRLWLAAFDMYSPYLNDSSLTEDSESPKYSYTISNDSVAFDDDREAVVVQGFTDADVYLEKDSGKILVAQIDVQVPKFQKTRMARATKTDAFFPKLENCTLDSYSDYEDADTYTIKPVWDVEDTKVVKLTEKGFVAAATGSTKITASFTAKNGDERSLTLSITVTNPKITQERIVLAVGVTKKLPVSGTCSDSTYLAGGNQSGDMTDGEEEERKEFQYSYLTQAGKLCGGAEGTQKAVLIIDGRELTLTIVVTNPHYAKNTFTLYKGLKKNLSIKGLNKKYSTITYTSKNTNTATVTKTGMVTAKKVGTVKLKIKADGKSFDVWVEIATKKAYQAAKKEIAISGTKTHYSQVKRMLKGYYDCSSLVSRVYRKFGVYFGSKSGWSPTAAGIGQWCTAHHKVIARKGVAYTKLVPGDLVFYSYTKNGRYLNISHIEMYVGNGMSVSASSSNNKVIHYMYSPNSVVLIARPLK